MKHVFTGVLSEEGSMKKVILCLALFGVSTVFAVTPEQNVSFVVGAGIGNQKKFKKDKVFYAYGRTNKGVIKQEAHKYIPFGPGCFYRIAHPQEVRLGNLFGDSGSFAQGRTFNRKIKRSFNNDDEARRFLWGSKYADYQGVTKLPRLLRKASVITFLVSLIVMYNFYRKKKREEKKEKDLSAAIMTSLAQLSKNHPIYKLFTSGERANIIMKRAMEVMIRMPVPVVLRKTIEQYRTSLQKKESSESGTRLARWGLFAALLGFLGSHIVLASKQGYSDQLDEYMSWGLGHSLDDE